MTISAEGSTDGDMLRSIALYRDHILTLQGRVTGLLALPATDADREAAAALTTQIRALQSVIELEVSLDKQTRALAGGAAVELDLVAARAEILARLAVWLAAG